MSLSDLLGLLFLLFFVILPALQGLRRAPPTPPVFPEEPFPEPQPAPKPKPKAKPRPKPPPAPALEPKGPEGESLEHLPTPERTPLEVRFREEVEETPTPKRRAKRLVSTDPESLLKGVIWHEILKRRRGF
jgi:outer membrane biosynthesis protein TonB